VRTNGGIPTVGQGARLAIAEPGDVVFIAAESFILSRPVPISVEGSLEKRAVLKFERAELLVYDLPDNFI
jgi:hypothetical protein